MAVGWPTANGWANGGDFWQDLEVRRPALFAGPELAPGAGR